MDEYVTQKEKFFSRVKPSGGCWEWQGARQPVVKTEEAYYGKVGQISSISRRKIYLAHRLSWELTRQRRIPNGAVVMHRCDNTLCVRPDHLQLGTLKDNTQDMKAKGRERKAVGEQSGGAKMTENKVRKIRSLFITGEKTRTELGKIYSLSVAAIRAITNYESWRHVK